MEADAIRQLALRTESYDMSKLGERLQDRATAGALLMAIQSAVEALKNLDQMKKAIFYGKPSPFLEEYRSNFALKEDAFEKMPLPEQRMVRTLHGVVGIATEGGELLEAFEKFYRGEVSELDSVNIMEEVGDVRWYEEILGDEHDFTIQQADIRRTAKLQKRFPGKFTEEDANNRDLVAERAILEGAGAPV